MIPAKFDYIKASSVSEAIGLLEKHGDDAKLLSGGHSLIPAMKLRLSRPEVLIDIGGISGLNSISEDGNEIVIGANCTHADIVNSDRINSDLNILAQTAKHIGDIQVRNRGTIGGSLAHADPAADYPAVVLACDAKIEVEGKGGKRTIPATEFFLGIFTTALAEDEIITAIRFPKVANGNYQKFFQSASRFAVVGVAAVKDGDSVKVGVTGVSGTPYRATAVENAYSGSSDAASHAVDGIDDLMSDHFADEEYRAHLAKVMVKKALEA
ncbi:xanthine dehydrogenase family protein subunit M [Maribacter algarum]|uniref:Xanthine dehydrogenase family protein subunit M n=1 Tax=Maribacter algarum (ex Zhang et al. 2020) TaxID=2578118 RepID=A0A5S3PQ04_9FLAO|nr:xanthine dehydrogenase family protein subunit M [Maribacter algarum]TMM56827.1 xanthine dehydrogenase family protein subunit M [Maribacter algarum]